MSCDRVFLDLWRVSVQYTIVSRCPFVHWRGGGETAVCSLPGQAGSVCQQYCLHLRKGNVWSTLQLSRSLPDQTSACSLHCAFSGCCSVGGGLRLSVCMLFSSVMDYFVTLVFLWQWMCSVLSKCSARLCFSANLLGLSKEKNLIYHWLGRYTCMSYIYSILFYYILVAQKERKRKHIILLVSSMFLKGTVSWFNFFGKLANIYHWLGI